MKGTIVRLMRDRGFGFIKADNGGDIFFHASEVKGVSFDDLTEGEAVDFERETDPRTGKPRATNVKPA